MKPTLFLLSFALVSCLLPAVAEDEHPLEAFFSAEVLPDKDAKKVQTHFEVSDHRPYSLTLEMYHTDLKKKLLGAVIEVNAESLNLTYDLVIEIDTLPYTRVEKEAPLFRGREIAKSDVTFKVKEFRYEELPDIDDPSKEDEDS
jgi:hypothetical protein